jgi:DNA-binding transcriptional MerR regulator
MVKTYTIKEVSRKLNIPQGTIKKWEKDLGEFLNTPRTKGGARFFTDNEIELISEIKQMHSNNMKINVIRTFLNEKRMETEFATTPVPIINDQKPTPSLHEESPLMNLEGFFNAMEVYKQNVIQEVKNEVQNVIRKEMVEEVKKEISKGSLLTVKSITNSIYKASENTNTKIQDISNKINQVTEQSKEKMDAISNKITNATNETAGDLSNLSNKIGIFSETSAKEFSTLEKTILNVSQAKSNQMTVLQKQLSKTSADLSQHFNQTNNDISELRMAVVSEQKNNLRSRDQLNEEIIQRETEFRNMLTAFREAATTKEKRWWQFW